MVGEKMAELRPWSINIDQEVQFDKKIGNGAFGIGERASLVCVSVGVCRINSIRLGSPLSKTCEQSEL